ncbi:MAG TPA: hypothetical protein VER96_16230 [Polyangiaceae bacterium]|nr:hypothetical protein [Polyangiaceae bacterium]
MKHLVPCPECNRHVRVSETACPFCETALDLAATPEPVLPRERLSRAATLAFGATFASATALAACSGTTDAPVPFYGAPGVGGGENAAGASGSAGANTSAGGSDSAVPVYGAPAAGGFNTGGPGSGNSGGGGPVPVYGAAP